MKKLHFPEDASTGVNLLLSLLIRFPEFTSIRYEPSQSLKLTLMLSGVLPANKLEILQSTLEKSIIAYSYLAHQKITYMDIQIKIFESANTILTISRDLLTLSKGELNLITAILKEHCKDILITDSNFVYDDDMNMHDESIENLLERMKNQSSPAQLIGIREDGRVLVFNK